MFLSHAVLSTTNTVYLVFVLKDVQQWRFRFTNSTVVAKWHSLQYICRESYLNDVLKVKIEKKSNKNLFMESRMAENGILSNKCRTILVVVLHNHWFEQNGKKIKIIVDLHAHLDCFSLWKWIPVKIWTKLKCKIRHQFPSTWCKVETSQSA